ALGSWLLADAADRLFPGRRAGVVAALLLNATLFLGVGSVIMTPDTPLLFFWCATVWSLARIAANARPGWWLVAGAFAGLALDSKYTAVMLVAGVVEWLAWVPPLRGLAACSASPCSCRTWSGTSSMAGSAWRSRVGAWPTGAPSAPPASWPSCSVASLAWPRPVSGCCAWPA